MIDLFFLRDRYSENLGDRKVRAKLEWETPYPGWFCIEFKRNELREKGFANV